MRDTSNRSWLADLFLMVILMMTSAPAWAELTAHVDRNPVSLGETLRLIIEVNGQLDTRGFDSSILNKNFEVLGTTSNSQIQIINGKQQVLSQLNIDLLPRAAGDFMIPPLEFAGDLTQPVSVTVKPASTDDVAGDISVEMNVDDLTPYVQQSVILTVKLFFAVAIVEGNLSDPQDARVQIRRLGEDTRYTADRQGVRYQVVERRFVITPRQSGSIDFKGVTFDGRAAIDSGVSGFSIRGKRYRVHAEPLTLEVQPKPKFSTGEWFPASDVQISEQWPETAPTFTVGEAITRTVRIEAHGVFGEQIPELALRLPEGSRGYADKASITTSIDKDMPVGVREQRIALVPVKAGRQVLPAVELNWWDTKADSQRVARLPERIIEVQPVPDTDSGVASGGQSDTKLSADQDSTPSEKQSAVTNIFSPVAHADGWRWLSVILAILWLATVGLWIGQQRTHRRKTKVTSIASQAIPLRQIQIICNRGDVREIRSALIEWARSARPDQPPAGLEDLALICDDKTVRDALARLDVACYANSTEAFDGAELWQDIRSWLPGFGQSEGTNVTRHSALPPLYPEKTTGER